MGNYSPPYAITNKMISLVASISEKIGSINITNNIDKRPYLKKNNRIKSIHSSLKIEANSLSLDEVHEIIDGRLVLGDRKEIQEVKNAYDAYEKIGSINPYDYNDLKKIHGIMTKYLIQESGAFRKGEEGVFDGDRCIFMAPPAKFVPNLMEELFDWMKKEKDNIHPLILSSIFHYEFVFIHPFTDGNGRMARLWHTALLSKWNKIFEYLPLENQIEKFQQDYYSAISKCHIDGESTIFIEFMLEQINNVLDDYSNQVKDNDEINSLDIKKLLDVMEYGIQYSTIDLMSKLSLSSREGFRRNYLKPALNGNYIRMTIPDKPNNKNQRYIKG